MCIGYVIRFQSIFNGSRVFVNPKAGDDPQDFYDLKVISNESIDFDDPKEFEDPKIFVYDDTSIFDGLVSTHKIGLVLDNDTG